MGKHISEDHPRPVVWKPPCTRFSSSSKSDSPRSHPDIRRLQDALVLHVFEVGFLSHSYVGDASVVFNQLVARQPTPLGLPLTINLGATKVPGKLSIQVTALDFGHELVQFAPQAPSFQPHYFVASSSPIASAASPATAPPSAYTLANGQQIFLQPMGTMPVAAPNGAGQTTAPITPLTSSAIPTPNGGFMFYAMPNGMAATNGSTNMPMTATAPVHPGLSQMGAYAGVPSDPAPPYPGLDMSQQYTADFTYEAPSAPTETVYQDDFNPRAGAGVSRPPAFTHSIVEQAPPPAQKPTLFPDGDSLI